MFLFFKKLKVFRTRPTSCLNTGEDVDFAWFDAIETTVMSEHMDKAKNAYLGLERIYHILLKKGTVYLDRERGSLVLSLEGAGVFVFAIEDVRTGAQIEAAVKLGGWILRMSPTGTGLVNITVVWSNRTYSLQGMPVDARGISGTISSL